MTFSQPVEVGNFIAANIGGFSFRSVSENNGILAKNGRKGVYERGIARFGNGSDALFFHYKNGTYEKRYNDKITAFGSDNIKNTINVNVMIPKLYKINSDKGITFYSINDSYDLPEEFTYTLLGRQTDGKWVKYFDTNELVKKYFGANQSYWLKELRVSGDTIIVYYELFSGGNYRNSTNRGEFRFKWNDKAQWFGVEQVIY